MIIYTDGATSNNGYAGAVGGWAYVIINDNEEIIAEDSGRVLNATNNICELLALINACDMASRLDAKGTYNIYSDSAYCINCFNQQWYKKWLANGWVNSKKEPVANRELWEQLIPFFESYNFNFEKVPAHSGHKWNEYVDKLAVAAKESD